MYALKHLVWLLFLISSQLHAQQRNLDFYIEKAKMNSPLIHKSEYEKKMIQLDLEQINRIYSKPEVTAEAGVLFAPIISHDDNKSQFQLVTKDANDYTGYDLAVTDGGQYQGIVSLRQGLLNKSKKDIYAEKADIDTRINDNNIELTVHELENVVKHQYIICLKSEKQAAGSLEIIGLLDDQLQTMKRLVENAIYKQSDLMLLEITRRNYEQEYETYLAEYKSNIYDLNLICGITENNEVQLGEITFQQNPLILTPSRFLTSYYLDSLSVATNLKISEIKYKPELFFFANGGMNAVYLPSFNRLGFSTGLTFGLTLYDGNQRDIERHKSVIQYENIAFEKQKSAEQNTIQKNFVLDKLNSLDKRILLTNKQIEQYDKLMDLYKIQLANGEFSVMEYKYLVTEISSKKQEAVLLDMEKQIVINAWNYWNY